jgi:hypothetical protein
LNTKLAFQTECQYAFGNVSSTKSAHSSLSDPSFDETLALEHSGCNQPKLSFLRLQPAPFIQWKLAGLRA